MEKDSRFRIIPQATSAGALAGGTVGLGEVMLVVLLGGSPSSLQATFWAVAAYGLLGLLGGLALGLVLALLPHPPGRAATYASVWALVFAGLGLFITRYRLYRDLFHESIRSFTIEGLLFNGGLLVAFGFLFLLLRWLWLRPFLRPIASIRGSSLACVLVLVLAGAISFVARPATALSTSPAGIPPGLENAPNVILIGVDTLRADRLSSYGYTGSQTPHMDALSADGVRYTEMTAQASWTKPSFASIFTSLYPSSHTATGKPHRLPESVITLAEVLAASGYHTGGFANNPSISPTFGFGQGFADYVYLEPDYLFGGNGASSQLALYQTLRRIWAMMSGEQIFPDSFYQEAAVVNRHALDWLEANKRTRFFLFLHYMDPHDPYFEHPYNGNGYARASDQNPDPALASTFSRLYDSEVRYLDEQLAQLFEWIKSEGLYEQTVVVLTSDHGEEFQEHGGWWHGQTLYQEQIAVPLIIKYPAGSGAGTVVNDLTQSLDIAPTILELAGVPAPDAMMGRSLSSSTEPPAFAFAEEDHEGNVLHALRGPAYKLILANPDNPRGLPTEEIFELTSDPGEQQDILSTQQDRVQAMRATLRQILTLALEQAVDGEVSSLDASLQDRLRDLGY